MPGLVPGIHVLTNYSRKCTSPAMTEKDGNERSKESEKPQCPLWLLFIAASCSGLAVP
jgi:hypothetical protein